MVMLILGVEGLDFITQAVSLLLTGMREESLLFTQWQGQLVP
jgi:hypothetical protein